MELSRRDFILSTTAAAAGVAAAAPADAQPAPIQIAQATGPSPRGFDPADPGLLGPDLRLMATSTSATVSPHTRRSPREKPWTTR